MDSKCNEYLDRLDQIAEIKDVLRTFDKNKTNLTIKRGIYLYGNSGTGKTEFIIQILKELNYDIVKYDAGDIRNKAVIETIASHNMSDTNVLSMIKGTPQKIAIIIDEIDGMNNGDKGGINSLIKLVRPKKTKKQKSEEYSMNPIICIGNYHLDKKIKELMKVCHKVELCAPSPAQITKIIEYKMPRILYPNKWIDFLQGDLRKLNLLNSIYCKNPSILDDPQIFSLFQIKTYNEDTKQITRNLISKKYDISTHNQVINETDRTTIGLLWHENIIDAVKNSPELYMKILDKICYSDYIDRITFQKQIWQFNEMSSLMKTYNCNFIYHTEKKADYEPDEIRFTKVLTKYSTEYNNSLFIQYLCSQLSLDKKDTFAFFQMLKMKYGVDTFCAELTNNCDEISRLDVKRIYRFMHHINKKDAIVEDYDSDESDYDDDDI